MGNFWGDLQTKFTDQFGLVAPNASRASTNGVCYTGEAMVIGLLNGEMDDVRRTWWKALMTSCEVAPGVLKRTPTDLEPEAPDDYYGYLAGARIADPARARAWLLHGLTHVGFYSTDGHFAWSNFLWRQPQLITLALFAARLPVGPLRAFFCLSLMLDVWQPKPTTDAGSRRLGWLLLQSWDGRGYFSRKAATRWMQQVEKDFHFGMAGVYTEYCGVDHPFAQYCPEGYIPTKR